MYYKEIEQGYHVFTVHRMTHHIHKPTYKQENNKHTYCFALHFFVGLELGCGDEDPITYAKY